MTTAIIYLFVAVCVGVLFAAVRWLVRPALSRLIMTPIMIVFCVPMVLSSVELAHYITWYNATIDERSQIKEEKLAYERTETEIVSKRPVHTRIYSSPGSSVMVRVPEFAGGKHLVSMFTVMASLGVGVAWLATVFMPSFVRWQKKQQASVKPIEATKPDKPGS